MYLLSSSSFVSATFAAQLATFFTPPPVDANFIFKSRNAQLKKYCVTSRALDFFYTFK